MNMARFLGMRKDVVAVRVAFQSLLVHLFLQDDERKQRKEEFEEAEFKSRHRSLGNIRFIGELFKFKVRGVAMLGCFHFPLSVHVILNSLGIISYCISFASYVHSFPFHSFPSHPALSLP